MVAKHLVAGIVAVAGLLLASPARAGDIIRLADTDPDHGATTRTLKATNDDLKADTLDVRGGWRGGWGGGWRGGWGGGWRGGWGGGWRGGWGWGGGWRGGWGWGGWGWRGGWGGGAYVYPRYWGGYYASPVYSYPVYSYPVYSYPVYSYYSPCTVVTTTTPTTTLRLTPSPSTTAPTMPRLPAPSQGRPSDGTFPYDGGPRAPVPMPPAGGSQVETPARIPTRPQLADERFVSLEMQPKKGKWVYPAYGEAPRRTGTSTGSR